MSVPNLVTVELKTTRAVPAPSAILSVKSSTLSAVIPVFSAVSLTFPTVLLALTNSLPTVYMPPVPIPNA